MQIAILGGTGRMGTGLSKAWVKAGHGVIIGSRDVAKARDAAKKIAREVHGAKVIGMGLRDAAEAGEVVVLAVPFGSAAGLLQRLRDVLVGKTIVDITNPFGQAPVGRSGMEVNAEALAVRAKWVAAFKTNFWKTLDQPVNAQGIQRDCFVCGDDAEAKQKVMQLAEDVGYRAVDCGSAQNALCLDLMVPLMLELDRRYNRNAFSSWKFLD